MLAEQNTSITHSIDKIESTMLQMPQADCPVYHKFGPGIYIREVHLPAGSLVLGHYHTHSHMNNMVCGELYLFDDNGTPSNLKAPQALVAKPGRKLAYIIEDVIWQNIYATDETDIDKLESTYLIKSDGWSEVYSEINNIEIALREIDRNDYRQMLMTGGKDSYCIDVSCETDPGKLTIRDSMIDGQGLFITAPAHKGEALAVAKNHGKVTQLGGKINHSRLPNAEISKDNMGNLHIVAKIDLLGCTAGNSGEEVTIDYRDSGDLFDIGGKL